MPIFDYLTEAYVWEIFLLFGLALVFGFVPTIKTLQVDDQYFLQHRGTVVHAALCILAYTLLYAVLGLIEVAWSNALVIYVWKHFSLLLVLCFIIVSYRLIGQSFALIGFNRQSLPDAILVGLKTAFVILAVYDVFWLLVPESLLQRFTLLNTSHKVEEDAIKYGVLVSGVATLLNAGSWHWLNVLIEELCYRGLLYSALRKHFRVLPVLLGSSLLFMLAHGWLSLSAFGIGCLTCYLYETRHSIVPSIIVHFTWNANLECFGWVASVSLVSPRSWYAGSLVLALVVLGVVHTSARADS